MRRGQKPVNVPVEEEEDDSKVEYYTEKDIEIITQSFMRDLIKFRKEASITPISCTPTSLVRAAELSQVATTGNDVSHLLTMQEEKDKQDQDDWLTKHMGHLIALLALMGLPIIGYMVISH